MSDKMGLTIPQSEVYRFLRVYYTEYGYFPKQKEIAEGVVQGEQLIPSRNSTASIHRILTQLVTKGWIARTPGGTRALKFL